MKTNLNVVLIPVEYLNSREIAENIEGELFKTTTALRVRLSYELISESDPEVEDGTEPNIENDVLIYPMTDFMEACNDQEINLEGFFISYVFFE